MAPTGCRSLCEQQVAAADAEPAVVGQDSIRTSLAYCSSDGCEHVQSVAERWNSPGLPTTTVSDDRTVDNRTDLKRLMQTLPALASTDWPMSSMDRPVRCSRRVESLPRGVSFDSAVDVVRT